MDLRIPRLLVVAGVLAATWALTTTPAEARQPAESSSNLLVRCEDTLIGKYREIPVDMVILCTALEPHSDADAVARVFSLSRSPDGFFLERHPKLDPVGTTTDGVYVAGCSQGPKDIPDSVAQAQADTRKQVQEANSKLQELAASTSDRRRR